MNTSKTPEADASIDHLEIHPAIGIARVGNGAGWFPGPEVVGGLPAGDRRDAKGGLNRQAARFRIFAYASNGKVIREVTNENARIKWTVHVANQKAAWYRFQLPLDIKEGQDPDASGAPFHVAQRNARFTDRRQLVIDGGLTSIDGAHEGAPVLFGGTFLGTRVPLGELQVDREGRLIFLGGRGKAAAVKHAHTSDETKLSLNSDGWYDDTSDGPVTAHVEIGTQRFDAVHAWVVTAPPNYAPGLQGVRTLYDLLADLHEVPVPEKVSFRDDVYPILRRLSDLQWVNSGFAAQFGHGRPYDVLDPTVIARLSRDPRSDGGDLYAESRRQILQAFRQPETDDTHRLPWPWLYGDADGLGPRDVSPRRNTWISCRQYAVLAKWVDGDFTPGWGRSPAIPTCLEDLPLDERPTALTRAALEDCLADAFDPGCEVSWPMRIATLYEPPGQKVPPALFRIAQGPPARDPDYGPTLDWETASGTGGPLYGQGPGGLTRWLALPWHADAADCKSGYDDYDPVLPTYWPARVPNHVLTEQSHAIVVDASRAREDRIAAYEIRTPWDKPLGVNVGDAQARKMVELYGSMGIVERRPGVPNDPVFPPVMHVASYGKGVERKDTVPDPLAEGVRQGNPTPPPPGCQKT